MKLTTRFHQIPYRTRRFLRRFAIAAGVLLAVGLLVWGSWMIWLQRYVIYTRDGASLDFGMNPTLPTGEAAVKPTVPELEFEYLDDDQAVGADTELKQLNGYHISAKDLEDIPAVTEQLKGLPRGTPVMVEVKNITGNFYYSSTVGETRPAGIDTAAMDELLEYLDKSGLYTIAYLPALRDYHYGLNHVPDGLPTSGGWLWMDSAGCYWLNPSSQGTLSYLVRAISELQTLGFNEVVLYDFYFPDTSSIVFRADKQEALTTAAKTLVTTCATDTFAVSFVCETDFQLPAGRCRMYKKNIAASQVENVAQNSGLETPLTHLVFLTDIHDTRFDAYGVLRPLP